MWQKCWQIKNDPTVSLRTQTHLVVGLSGDWLGFTCWFQTLTDWKKNKLNKQTNKKTCGWWHLSSPSCLIHLWNLLSKGSVKIKRGPCQCSAAPSVDAGLEVTCDPGAMNSCPADVWSIAAGVPSARRCEIDALMFILLLLILKGTHWACACMCVCVWLLRGLAVWHNRSCK